MLWLDVAIENILERANWVQVRMTQKAIKQVLTERYYSWQEAELLAQEDPESTFLERDQYTILWNSRRKLMRRLSRRFPWTQEPRLSRRLHQLHRDGLESDLYNKWIPKSCMIFGCIESRGALRRQLQRKLQTDRCKETCTNTNTVMITRITSINNIDIIANE